jgi:hypothetical protein
VANKTIRRVEFLG